MRIVNHPAGGRLALTNDGPLEAFFLGVGGAFSRTLGNTNVLLVKGPDHVMIDFGVTGPSRLWELARRGPEEIDRVLVTHVHADNAGGLEQMGLMGRYVAKRRPILVAPRLLRTALWQDTLRGGLQHVDGARAVAILDDYFEAAPMARAADNTYRCRAGGIELEMFPTRHVVGLRGPDHFVSYGVCVDGRLFLSGDSRFDPEAIASRRGCEAFFLDCAAVPNPTHACLAELKTLPEDVRSRAYLVHYGDDFTDRDAAGFAGRARAGVRYVFDPAEA